jgi:hypothetical protein
LGITPNVFIRYLFWPKATFIKIIRFEVP